MNDNVVVFAIFWGVWLLVPMLIDGGTSLLYLAGSWQANRSRQRHPPRPLGNRPPLVSIIVPVYNGEKVLGDCLRSIQNQTYPHDRIEIIVVNNRSTDNTNGVFLKAHDLRFAGRMSWVSINSKGKPWALNAGYHAARGIYLCNIDADVVLHPDAIKNAVTALESNHHLGAVTATVEVTPLEGPVTPLKRILAECEFLEYVSGFRIGRQYQSRMNSLFTLAGAFSMFRREVILRTGLYSKQTVSEDTHLTFQLHQTMGNEYRVSCLPDVVAYVGPTETLSQLYAQRVRWQRGQIEVVALYPRLVERSAFAVRGLAPSRTLLVDHTLAFPRVIWTFLLPLLYFFGYSLNLVVSAMVGMYVCYAAVEGISAAVSYLLADDVVRERIHRQWWIFFMMPGYRFMLFWFRFGGFVSVFTEPAVWRTTPPWSDTRQGLIKTQQAINTTILHIRRSVGIV